MAKRWTTLVRSRVTSVNQILNIVHPINFLLYLMNFKLVTFLCFPDRLYGKHFCILVKNIGRYFDI